MLNLKKTAVAVLALGSSAVFAGTMGPICAPGNVTVPCASSAWEFGGQALYLKPSYSAYLYDSVTTTTPAVAGTGATVATYNSTPYSWQWGFKIEGAYHFNTGNDFNINWYQLSNSSNAAEAGTVTGPLGTFTGAIATSSKPTWDAVNFEFGQHAHFGEFKNIRFHGGFQYGYIKTDYSAALGAGTPVVAVLAANDTQKYSGFGPRIGGDYWYNWGNGISMYANGATALLVGTQSFNDTAVLAATPAAPFNVNGSTTAIVPELEAKVGLTYTYAMAQGDLTLDVGWMWVNYFNALHDASLAGGAEVKSTDFGVQGLLFGLKWLGNVA